MKVSVFDEIEALAQQVSWIHSRDTRAKVIVVLAFLVTLISFKSHTVSALLPLFILPLSWAIVSFTHLKWLLQKIFLPVIFLSIFGLANVFFDKTPQGMFFGITITGGFISWCSIVLRALLSLSIILLLMATTGIVRLSDALVKLKVPHIMVTILLLLYRYIFVLCDEASRMNRARNSRSFGKRGLDLTTASALLGQLLLRSLARANNIHSAMLARGFNENNYVTTHNPSWTANDTITTASCFLFLLLVRFGNFSNLAGTFILGKFP